MSTDRIEDNYHLVVERIASAAVRAGRHPADIRIVAVSKKQPVEKIRQAVAAGATILGENYPEEALEKIGAITDHVEWHMIGHLQSRKARIVAEHFHGIHSIDSLHTAIKLEKALIEADRHLTALLEVGLAGESQKHGYDLSIPEGKKTFLDEIEQIRQLTCIHLSGIMVMPPYVDDPQESRPFFRQGKQVLLDLQLRYPDMDWKELSMGTSQDYSVAVEEGATLVRVGTAIFGER